MTEKLTIDSKSYITNLRKSGSNFTLEFGEEVIEGFFSKKFNGSLELKIGKKRHICYSEKSGNEIYVFINGNNYLLKRSPHKEFGQEVEEESSDVVTSPITGKLLDRKVAEGTNVSKGEVIIILEAMKMEHQLKSPRDGKIIKITNSTVGGQVKEGDLMFELEEE